jgi:hypothetical protein
MKNLTANSSRLVWTLTFDLRIPGRPAYDGRRLCRLTGLFSPIMIHDLGAMLSGILWQNIWLAGSARKHARLAEFACSRGGFERINALPTIRESMAPARSCRLSIVICAALLVDGSTCTEC